jgi:Protein of unknown function (DUF664)
MTEVERGWFRRRFGGQTGLAPLYYSDGQPDGDFDLTDAAAAEAVLASFTAECTAADEAARGHSLDDTFVSYGGQTLDLRWIYLHMIEAYARHNGHADLIRELIDGVTGD